jgi:hypothetical protein
MRFEGMGIPGEDIEVVVFLAAAMLLLFRAVVFFLRRDKTVWSAIFGIAVLVFMYCVFVIVVVRIVKGINIVSL